MALWPEWSATWDARASSGSDVLAGSLAATYARIRAQTEALAAPVTAEDQQVQPMPDASPMKWHRAHTTWFFETFVLRRFAASYRIFDPHYDYLFNSYYESVGARHPRAERGLLTRPGAAEVARYRTHVDEAMASLAETALWDEPQIAALVTLGLHHEQQHQELMLTDLLNAFAANPLCPAYAPYQPAMVSERAGDGFTGFDGGTVSIGHAGEGFAFDNETPKHDVLLAPYRLGERAVTNGEWMDFMEAGGYREPAHWLADGWRHLCNERWEAPFYWRRGEGGWWSMTLSGLHPVDPRAPVTHVSYYEADAFARWRGKRLPTEAEWENAARREGDPRGNFLDSGTLRPLMAAPARGALAQMFGDVWEWTASAYAPYPGFTPAAGAVGEYNGKFMVNQMVLRGGSCVTPGGHVRATYRNFFYPHQRWQFSGLRLAEDAVPRRVPSRDSDFAAHVREGLSRPHKALSCKYFYDREGSRLFDAICDLPEYYPTRTEIGLLRSLAPQWAAVLPEGTALVEFGSGSARKTRLLLDAMPSLSAYVPVDISADHLSRAADEIAARYPRLAVIPVAADFTGPIALPDHVRGRPLAGFFPGSTIGNFAPAEAVALLASMRAILGHGASLLIGFDRVKDAGAMIAAYDDAAGITAAFNKNILVRINRELGGDFDLSAFAHEAVWNARDLRIEMRLRSLRAQSAAAAGRRFVFGEGETIHTENAHKYTVAGFSTLASRAGWGVERLWESTAPAFAVALLR